MKIGIIGHSDHVQTVLAKAIIQKIEEKTGENVEIVELRSEEKEVLMQNVLLNEPDPIVYSMVERPFIPPIQKRKGHQRPYKYHK